MDMPSYLEMRRKFLANRATFSVDELSQYAGMWIAWSPDGSRIAASSSRPELLEEQLRARGEDPTCCVIEGIPSDDQVFGEIDGSAA